MKKLVLLILASVFSVSVTNAQMATRVKQFNVEKGVAIQGYDPVAYFTQGKALKGSKSNAAIAEGITYYFSSAANKDLFLKDFKKYEPQYGGWCAYAMGSSGEKVKSTPKRLKL